MIFLDGNDTCLFISDPRKITLISPKVPNTYVLPYYGDPVIIDYSKNISELQKITDLLSKAVEEVEACDPWVKDVFGIDGVGEGIVYYPISPEHLNISSFRNLCFKAKGEKHKMVNQKKLVQVDAEIVSSVDEFVKLVLTEARLEQGVAEVCGGEYDIKNIGPFIGFVCSDVKKECQSELEASALTWKQAAKSVSTKARLWFINRHSSI